MYTRCPQCRTTFAVSDEQLEARGGVVRCGECHHVFRADRYLMDALPSTVAPRKGEPRSSGMGQAAVDKKSVSESNRPATDSIKAASKKSSSPLPTLDELLWGKKRSRIRPVFWALGNLLVLAVMGGQFIYFYSTELAQYPELRPYIRQACDRLGCTIRPQVDAGLIEITQTRVSPHPKYERVLRLRASLINRASFSQPFPLMEVSLSNHRGQLVGRRTYRPEEYLKKSKDMPLEMIPNVIVRAELEFTTPNLRADGFEIRLIADTG
jgi:predicted Zn finger-like uncharacterized protein